MLQLSFALALTLLYGDIISPESAALPLHWQAGTSGTVKFAHGITRSYEAVQDGSHVFGNEVSPGGEPDLSTRRRLGTGRLIGLGAIGDDFFVVSASEDSKSLNVVRVRDSKALSVPISTFETFVDVTSNGTRLLLTYIQLGAGRGMLLDRDLNLVVPPIVLMPIAGSIPSATPLARQFFVVTKDTFVFQGLPVTYKIALIDDSGSVQTIGRGLPAGTCSGAGSELFYILTGGTAGRTAYLQRYSPTLTPIDDLTVIAQTDRNPISTVSAVRFGKDLFASWIDGHDLYVRRLGTNEQIQVDGPFLPNNSLELGPDTLLARWIDIDGNRLVRRVDVDDRPHPDVYVPAEERGPSVASDGVTPMIAWAENDVRIARIAPDGSSLDGSGIVISQSPVHPSGAVQIVWEDNRYLVFWAANGALLARYVERDGTPSGSVFRVSPADDVVIDFQAAWTGAQYLLTWQHYYDTAGLGTMAPGGVAAVKVGFYDTLGGVTGGPHPMVFGLTRHQFVATFFDTGKFVELSLNLPGGMGSFHAASSGRDYVVTWTTTQGIGNFRYQNTVWAAKLDDGGQPVGTPLQITTFESGQLNIFKPDASGVGIPLFDGTNYRIVYAGATLGEAILGDDAFICHCFARTELPFDTASMEKLSATLGADGSVIAYTAPVLLPDGGTVRDRVFIRFAHPAVPPKRHAAGR